MRGEVRQHSLPFLSLPDQRKLLQELPQCQVQHVAGEIEKPQVFLGNQRVKVIPEIRIILLIVLYIFNDMNKANNCKAFNLLFFSTFLHHKQHQ